MFVKSCIAAAALCFAATSASAISYSATFSGAAENPANASTATGFGTLRVIDANTIFVDIDYSGLSAGLAAGHIHCCSSPTGNAGVAINFSNLSLGATSGSYTRLFDLSMASTFTSGFITSSGGTAALASARLLAALDNDQVYFNLHNSVFPGGEIRGNLAAVPEPASWAMLVVGFGLVGGAVRRKQKQDLRPAAA